MERPFAVTLLASFFFVQSLINVVIVAGYYLEALQLFAIYYLITSVVGFVLSYALWKGLSWGRFGTMAFSGWEILIGLLGTFMSLDVEPASPIQALTKTIVYTFVIYFMTRPEIKEYFEK